MSVGRFSGFRVITIGLAIVGGVALAVWVLVPREPAQECLVYSHNGEVVLEPACVVRFSDGRADFIPKQRVGILVPDWVADSGGETFVTGPGCGLLRRTVGREEQITLPPPIRLVVEVSGQYPLPSGKDGILLMLHSEAEDPRVAALLDRGPVAAGYWDEPSASRSRDVWIDPSTRSASVLLPCAGPWRIEWNHTPRVARGLSLVFGMGECRIQVAGDGQHQTLEIHPEDLTGIMEPDR